MASLAWKQRRTAVGKKLAPDVELLMDAEPLMTKNAAVESSPVTVAATFKEKDLPPEMQSFILPGAWTVVGKNGRPLKNSKTYLPPKAPKKKKKRSSKKAVEDELHASLTEMPSSSKCLDKLERAASKREKESTCGRDARYWARYRQAKKEQVYALDALTASLGDAGMLGDAIEPGMIERPHPPAKVAQRRNNKGDRHAEKVRRNARFASQAAKCYSLETDMERDEAMIRTLQWEAQRPKPAACKPPSAKCKEGKAASEGTAASGLSKWLPEMKRLKSMVAAALQEEADAESIERRGDVKKRKDDPSPSHRKTGKKSKLWREGKKNAEQEGSKRCSTM